jgi:excisionase family DNA binding protein
VDRLLTLKEVAELLQVNERTALRLAHAGELPAARVGGQWRVHPVELERWFLRSRRAEAPEAGEEEGLFSARNVLLDCPASSVEEVLRTIAEHLAATGQLIYPDLYRRALRHREEMLSTGVGGGVAIPHARHAVNGLFRRPLCVFLRLARPVDFRAVDGAGVDLVFAVAAPTNATHLTSLAAVMRIARDDVLRERLRRADPAAVAALCEERRRAAPGEGAGAGPRDERTPGRPAAE